MTKTLAPLITAFCLLTLISAVHAEDVEIATFNYPPFMDMSNRQGGLLGEIVHAAFSHVGINPKFTYYPPLRMFNCYIGAKDVLACMGPVTLIQRQPLEKQEQLIYMSPMVNINMVLLYYRPTHGDKPTTYDNLSALQGYRVGVINGSNTIPILKNNGMAVIETNITSQMKMLKASRLDYCAIGFLTGMELIKTLFPADTDDFVFMKKPIMELPVSIYFNKGFPGSAEYADAFRKGIQSLVANGRYIEILEHYYGKNKIPAEYRSLFDALGVQYTF